MPTSQDLQAELEAACQGLLWRSETDAPFELVVLPAAEPPLDVGALLANGDYPPDSPVEIVSLDNFFAPVMEDHSWFDAQDSKLVEGCRHLRSLLEATLENLKVYRIGSVEIDVYLLGQTEDKQIVGVKTTVVET